MDSSESIYNLIPREYEQPAKAPKHSSKFRSTVKDEAKSGKYDKKTMGPSKVPLKQPQEFLKKHEKEPKLPPKQKFEFEDNVCRRPAVPKAEEKPVMGLRTNKNFIHQNAVETIMSVPKKPDKKFVDTKKGDKHALPPSGLEPKYIHKRDYGDVPKYLSKRNEDIRAAQDEYNQYIRERQRMGAMQSLSDDERHRILDGLKTNWENLHHEYQGLSVVTDTTPKKNRKERMEAEMKQLERDIEMIEKHRTIFIAN